MAREILLLSGADVESLLDPDTAIASQREAFEALGRGEAELPGKIMHASRHDDSVFFAYTSRLSARTGAVAKCGSVNPSNASLGLPSVSAVVVAFDARTGAPAALLDGTALTTLRTAAASAVAVDALATARASGLAVLGSGIQGRAHVRAIARVRPLSTVRVWSPSPERRAEAAAALSDELGIAVQAVDTAREAVADLPIVATCTLSHTPVVHGAWLSPGCAVVSVGSFEPTRREVDAEVLRRARTVVVDDRLTALEHAGPVIAALRAGDLSADGLVSLGEVVTGDTVARSSARDIVYYNSVGLGVQDAAAAWAVIAAAERGGDGRPVGGHTSL